MGKHLFVFGHGYDNQNRLDPGATGNGTSEHKFLNEEFLPALKKHAPSNVDFYTTANMYARREAKSISGYDSVTELHLDWANGASGGHVIIYKDFDPDKIDLKIRDIVKKYVGLRMSSGISRRDNLYNLNTFAKRGITYRLVELGFINHSGDMKKIRDNIDDYAADLMQAVTGRKVAVSGVSKDKAPEPSDDNLYRLVTGSFADAGDLAEAKQKLRDNYNWTMYEKADDIHFDPTLRIVTGTFKGKNVAQFHADQLKEEFGWNVYVKEA